MYDKFCGRKRDIAAGEEEKMVNWKLQKKTKKKLGMYLMRTSHRF